MIFSMIFSMSAVTLSPFSLSEQAVVVTGHRLALLRLVSRLVKVSRVIMVEALLF